MGDQGGPVKHGRRISDIAPRRAASRPAPQPVVQRRSSFEIADDYVELNFKPIIEADAEEGLSKRELRRRRREQHRQQKRHHYVRNSIITAIVLVGLAVGTALLWWKTSSQPVNPDDQGIRQFTVDNGATADQIADSLRQAGFIRSTLAFRIYVRLNDNTVQAGIHMLSPSYDLSEIVKRLSTANTDEISVQIPPGLTMDELRKTFEEAGYTDAQIEEAYSATYTQSILADRPQGASLEGYLYPDTYRVYRGDSLTVLFNKALDQMQAVANDNNLPASFAAHGLSFYQGLTLASIITKEVQSQDDQRLVASVFYNRLNAGMSLGSDVTFQYAYKQGLCTENTPDCQSAYNTRLNEGLPPGPIANPSLTAMLAVANPAESNYYYFVAGEDGHTYFSETADQHNQAVADHCGDLCN